MTLTYSSPCLIITDRFIHTTVKYLIHHTLYNIHYTMDTLVNAYENLLVDNVGTVRSVESGLRNLTWLLPGRFEDADVASEGRMFPLLKFS